MPDLSDFHSDSPLLSISIGVLFLNVASSSNMASALSAKAIAATDSCNWSSPSADFARGCFSLLSTSWKSRAIISSLHHSGRCSLTTDLWAFRVHGRRGNVRPVAQIPLKLLQRLNSADFSTGCRYFLSPHSCAPLLRIEAHGFAGALTSRCDKPDAIKVCEISRRYRRSAVNCHR